MHLGQVLGIADGIGSGQAREAVPVRYSREGDAGFRSAFRSASFGSSWDAVRGHAHLNRDLRRGCFHARGMFRFRYMIRVTGRDGSARE